MATGCAGIAYAISTQRRALDGGRVRLHAVNPQPLDHAALTVLLDDLVDVALSTNVPDGLG